MQRYNRMKLTLELSFSSQATIARSRLWISGERLIAPRCAEDEMKRTILGPGVVDVRGEDGGQVVLAGQREQLVAVGVTGQAPGSAVGVEADVEVGGIELLGTALGQVGAIARRRGAWRGV
jgi:hypothetical protein